MSFAKRCSICLYNVVDGDTILSETCLSCVNYSKYCPDEKKISINDIREYHGLDRIEEEDLVNHPSHYQTKKGLEMIDIIEAIVEGLEGIEATDTGNVAKYIGRWKKKNGVQDLEKAKWYLEHLIKHVKENEKEIV